MDLGKAFTDWKDNTGTLWLWLGLILLLVNVVGVGWTRPEFPYGITYSFGFIAVGIVLSHTGKKGDEAPVLAAIFAALIGLVAVIVDGTLSGSVSGVFSATAGAVLSVLLFVGVLMLEAGVEIGPKASYAKYATLAAFGLWALWPAIYFYQRLSLGSPLNFMTDMYHGGIMLLAGFDFITFAGAWKFRYRSEIRLVLWALAVIGALLLVGVLGWGLRLLP